MNLQQVNIGSCVRMGWGSGKVRERQEAKTMRSFVWHPTPGFGEIMRVDVKSLRKQHPLQKRGR
jgi:hypothetical protein